MRSANGVWREWIGDIRSSPAYGLVLAKEIDTKLELHRSLALATSASLLVFCAVTATDISARAQTAPSTPAKHEMVIFHEPQPLQFSDHKGFTEIFDGKSPAEWEGDPTVWRVVDGAIVGESSKEHPVFNTYIWRKGLVVKDFDLKLEIKCKIGGGSGIQYRSQTGIPWIRKLP